MENINIEQIMEEIRAEIKEKGYKESDLSFQDIPVEQKLVAAEQYNAQQLSDSLRVANMYTRVDYYRPITGHGLKTTIKKAIRKILKPLLLPICQNQEQFNAGAVQTMNQMHQYMLLQEKRIDELEAMLMKKEN